MQGAWKACARRCRSSASSSKRQQHLGSVRGSARHGVTPDAQFGVRGDAMRKRRRRRSAPRHRTHRAARRQRVPCVPSVSTSARGTVVREGQSGSRLHPRRGKPARSPSVPIAQGGGGWWWATGGEVGTSACSYGLGCLRPRFGCVSGLGGCGCLGGSGSGFGSWNYTGSRTVNTAPPSSALWAPIVPPYSSATLRAIVSPMPAPRVPRGSSQPT